MTASLSTDSPERSYLARLFIQVFKRKENKACCDSHRDFPFFQLPTRYNNK